MVQHVGGEQQTQPPEIPAGGDPLIEGVLLSQADYYALIWAVLDSVGDWLTNDSPLNQAAKFMQQGGRVEGATFDEKFLRPGLVEYADQIKLVAQAAVDSIELERRSTHVEFLGFRAPTQTVTRPKPGTTTSATKARTAKSDAATRTAMDAWLDFAVRDTATGEARRLRTMVNIKYTRGRSADNCGGRGMAAWALLGDEFQHRDGYSVLTQAVESLTGPQRLADYFFWTFTRGDGRPFDSVHATSLLTLTSEQLTFNRQQAFPHVQAAFHRPSDRGTGGGMRALRRRFILWFLSKECKYHLTSLKRAFALTRKLRSREERQHARTQRRADRHRRNP